MSIKQRIKSGGVFVSAAGPSLLDSLWSELVKEWVDPDAIGGIDLSDPEENYDAGYCVGLAYAIAKIRYPYVEASMRIERVLAEARGRVQGSQ